METTNLLPYAHQSIDASDIEAVVESLTQEMITRGPQVIAFEQEVCKQVGVAYAVAFSSGSTALSAAFSAARVGAADRIVTTPNTFIATIAGGVRLGAKVRCVDLDKNGNIDIGHLSDQIGNAQSRGRTILVPVHFAGVAVDMQQLDSLIEAPETVVIEDAAHAFGSFYPDGAPVGCCRYSDMTIFSFNAVKNITCGEGGMVTTNDTALYSRLKKIRDSGIERMVLKNHSSPEPWYYEVDELSSNYHMSELQAALGRSQLRRLDLFAQKKSALVALYRKKLASVPAVTLPPSDADALTHRHLFSIDIEFDALGRSRTGVMEALRQLGVGSQYHYVPLYRHPALASAMTQSSKEFPAMEERFRTSLSIPFFSKMTEADADRVVTALRKVLFQL